MINISSLNKGLVAHFRLASDLQKVGANIITGDNSTFDALADWTAYNSGSLAIVGDWAGGAGTGKGKITLHTTGASGVRMISLSGLTIGKTYYGSIKSKLLSGSSVTMYLGYVGNASASIVFVPTATETVFTGTFVAFSSTMYIAANTGSDSQEVLIDDVYVKPLLIADLTPYGNHPQNFGVTLDQADRKGVANGAGAFANTEYFDCGDVDFSDGLSGFSASAWVYPTVLGNDDGFFGKSNGGNDRFVLAVRNGDGGVIGAVCNGAASYAYTGDGKLALTTWAHVLMVFDGTGATDADKFKIYVNGSNEALTFNASPPTTMPTNNISLKLGREPDNALRFFNGNIGEIKMWNRALTATEILAEYNSYKSNLVVS